MLQLSGGHITAVRGVETEFEYPLLVACRAKRVITGGVSKRAGHRLLDLLELQGGRHVTLGAAVCHALPGTRQRARLGLLSRTESEVGHRSHQQANAN